MVNLSTVALGLIFNDVFKLEYFFATNFHFWLLLVAFASVFFIELILVRGVSFHTFIIHDSAVFMIYYIYYYA